MANFLDLTTGLPALWAKIKSKFYTKAEVDALIPESEIFIVNITYDSENDKTIADKSQAEVENALNAGKIIRGLSEDDVYYEYDGVYFYHNNPLSGSKYNEVYSYITNSSINELKFANFTFVSQDDLTVFQSNYLSKFNTTSYTPTADYHPATKKYVDAATAGVSPNLSGLADTNISNPANGQVLKYDSTSSKWVNSDASSVLYVPVTGNTTNGFATTANFDDVYTAYQNGYDIKAINGTNVYNLSTIASAGMAFSKNTTNALYSLTWTKSSGKITYGGWSSANIAVSSLSDTTISSPTDGQVLQYDATTSKWVNTTFSAGVTETRVNELIAAALAQYGDGDTMAYGGV